MKHESAEDRESKVLPLPDATELVSNGASLAIGGAHSHNGSMAFVRELINDDVNGLHLIPNVSAGIPADLLIGAGCVDSLHVCYVGLEHFGLAPNFRREAESGNLDIDEGSELSYVLGLKAGAANLPFVVLPHGYEATDIPSANPDVGRVDDPYSGEQRVTLPPIQPDVGVVHAAEGDRFGNVRMPGSVFQDDLIAKAAESVIVTVENIIPNDDIRARPKQTTIPGFMVDAVVETPYGAHPTSCQGEYNYDDEHLKEYKRLCEEEGVESYLEEYVRDMTLEDYLERVGIRRLVDLHTRRGDTV
jgi:glutaconate CoA-transferase subunit A